MAPNSAGEVIFVKIIIFESVKYYFMACTPCKCEGPWGECPSCLPIALLNV